MNKYSKDDSSYSRRGEKVENVTKAAVKEQCPRHLIGNNLDESVLVKTKTAGIPLDLDSILFVSVAK